MLIDIHVHTAKYSPCSTIELEEAIIKAKDIGLTGICITDHESNGINNMANELSEKHNFLVIVGMELLTYEGDLLIFGLEDVPAEKMHADALTNLVTQNGGIAISAHPFRENGRGMGEKKKKVPNLSGVEAFNGNTKLKQNIKAYTLGAELGIACLGGSDAHKIENLGQYVTVCPDGIRDVKDFIGAVKENKVFPAIYNKSNNKFEEVRV